MIYALARKDGSVVWQWQAPGGTNAWPAVAGDTILWPFGLGDSPAVIALRLGSNQPTPTPEQQRTPVMTPVGPVTDANVNYFVLPHGGEPLAPHDLWAAWTFEPAIVVSAGPGNPSLRVGNCQGVASGGTGARRTITRMPCVCRRVARPGPGAHVAARRPQRFTLRRAHGPAPAAHASRRAAAPHGCPSPGGALGIACPVGPPRSAGRPMAGA